MIKHAKEFLRYLRNHQYEKTGAGILFPRAQVLASGVFTDFINGEKVGESRNLAVDEGLVYYLNVGLAGGAQLTSWYVALFNGAATPQASWTAANFAANATEITTGYTEATRPLWDPDAVDVGNTSIENAATPASFTIDGTLAIEGAALLSSNVKGGTAGTLLSATRYASTRNLNDGDTYNSQYRVDFNAV